MYIKKVRCPKCGDVQEHDTLWVDGSMLGVESQKEMMVRKCKNCLYIWAVPNGITSEGIKQESQLLNEVPDMTGKQTL